MNREDSSQTGISKPQSMGETRRRGRKRSWKRTLLRWGLGFILGLLVLYVIWCAVATVMLSRAKARVAKAGESLELADYIAPQPADEENASLLLQAIEEVIKGKQSDPRDLSQRWSEIYERGGRITAEDIELFQSMVHEFDLALRIMDDAMPRKQAWFDTGHEQLPDWAINIPPLVYRQYLADLLRARAIVAADEARFDDAYTSAAQMFRLANWVHQETPVLVQSLTAIAIEKCGCDTVEYVMNLSPPSEEQRHRILDEVRYLPVQEDILNAFRVERASILDSLLELLPTTYILYERPSAAWKGFLLHCRLRPYLMMNAAAALNAETRLIGQAALDSYEQPEGFPAIKHDLPWWAQLAAIAIPDFYQVIARRDVALAKMDLLKIAFELEGYREARGEYPDSLDAVEGESLIDPFSGEGYLYRKTKDGYLLWSLSANRKDDGGEEARETEDWKAGGDIVWTVKR